MKMKWEEKFIELYTKGKVEEAKKLKNIHVPNKLYKYQKIDLNRLKNLEDGKLYFSNRKNLNDPFDLLPAYYDEDEVVRLLKEEDSPANSLSKEDIINKIDKVLNSFSNHIKILSLSTSIYNIPLWTHYGDNHRGMCIEYDIDKLDRDSDFYDCLLKVSYIDKKIEITKVLKNTLSNLINHDEIKTDSTFLLYFTLTMKHKSWQYENEWRIILKSNSGECGIEKSPMKVKAIYLGKDCSKKNIDRVVEISKKLNCEVYKMEYSKGIDFRLIPKKLY
ncbi:DUF2971 domain-containing protein [Paraclostridium ghonii]|uniref:DUF2971 domain-containing protein n=1 Tax=Paraclostridium ghonii TaxID=29358 RepID=UPI00202CC39F|nr:DUF2971 domain-containing protein [Paeniclostridium ghonii]MCM0166969.1 DUF2971 domain-containing protein [Paeniclostridium ghonii]